MSENLLEAVKTVSSQLPARLHHMAWVVEDQERTRAFYEDMLGLPLVQFWIETTKFQDDDIVLSHAFYGMADGSALAFFCLSEPAMKEKYKSPHTKIFNHVAFKVDESLLDTMIDRVMAAKYENFEIEHGYCRSLYLIDPDGLRLEFTMDSPEIDKIVEVQARTAHDTLKRWRAGDRTSNNDWRHHD